MVNIAIFASGSGSNAENIFNYFSRSSLARVVLIVCDNPSAGVLGRASRLGIPAVVVPRKDFRVLPLLRDHNIDFIVLAGFLSLVPAEVIDAYRGRIVNIHPALLPRFGGKGMYGDRVHKAVIEAAERESGITIHHVDENFDTGNIIAQFRVPVAADDTPQTLAEKIHALEYEHFPQEIEKLLKIS